MNDEFNPKNPADEWEMSLPEIFQTKTGSSVQNSAESAVGASQNFSQPQAETAEEWAMTNPLAPPDTPLQTSWQLPAPVFRCSDGYTPKKFTESSRAAGNDGQIIETKANSFAIENAPTASPAPLMPSGSAAEFNAPAAPEMPLPVAANVAAIEPQPDLAEVFADAPATAQSVKNAEPKSKFLRVILTIFGILAMFAVAIGFLFLVYFLFFQKPAQ